MDEPTTTPLGLGWLPEECPGSRNLKREGVRRHMAAEGRGPGNERGRGRRGRWRTGDVGRSQDPDWDRRADSEAEILPSETALR